MHFRTPKRAAAEPFLWMTPIPNLSQSEGRERKRKSGRLRRRGRNETSARKNERTPSSPKSLWSLAVHIFFRMPSNVQRGRADRKDGKTGGERERKRGKMVATVPCRALVGFISRIPDKIVVIWQGYIGYHNDRLIHALDLR